MSLRVLDLLCSAILARPSSTPTIQASGLETGDFGIDTRDHRTLALSANYESCSIIESIVQKFATVGALDTGCAENFLQMLREWSQALPEGLRRSPRSSGWQDYTHRETTIGNIHVACTYYFGVILVTRQFLISRVMMQLRKKRAGKGAQREGLDGENSKAAQFSEGCVESATLMAQLCHDASKSGVLLGNMCILKYVSPNRLAL